MTTKDTEPDGYEERDGAPGKDAPTSPGPPPSHPDDDDSSVDSPDETPKSPGPPPGSVPGNR